MEIFVIFPKFFGEKLELDPLTPLLRFCLILSLTQILFMALLKRGFFAGEFSS